MKDAKSSKRKADSKSKEETRHGKSKPSTKLLHMPLLQLGSSPVKTTEKPPEKPVSTVKPIQPATNDGQKPVAGRKYHRSPGLGRKTMIHKLFTDFNPPPPKSRADLAKNRKPLLVKKPSGSQKPKPNPIIPADTNNNQNAVVPEMPKPQKLPCPLDIVEPLDLSILDLTMQENSNLSRLDISIDDELSATRNAEPDISLPRHNYSQIVPQGTYNVCNQADHSNMMNLNENIFAAGNRRSVLPVQDVGSKMHAFPSVQDAPIDDNDKQQIMSFGRPFQYPMQSGFRGYPDFSQTASPMDVGENEHLIDSPFDSFKTEKMKQKNKNLDIPDVKIPPPNVDLAKNAQQLAKARTEMDFITDQYKPLDLSSSDYEYSETEDEEDNPSSALENSKSLKSIFDIDDKLNDEVIIQKSPQNISKQTAAIYAPALDKKKLEKTMKKYVNDTPNSRSVSKTINMNNVSSDVLKTPSSLQQYKSSEHKKLLHLISLPPPPPPPATPSAPLPKTPPPTPLPPAIPTPPTPATLPPLRPTPPPATPPPPPPPLPLTPPFPETPPLPPTPLTPKFPPMRATPPPATLPSPPPSPPATPPKGIPPTPRPLPDSPSMIKAPHSPMPSISILDTPFSPLSPFESMEVDSAVGPTFPYSEPMELDNTVSSMKYTPDPKASPQLSYVTCESPSTGFDTDIMDTVDHESDSPIEDNGTTNQLNNVATPDEDSYDVYDGVQDHWYLFNKDSAVLSVGMNLTTDEFFLVESRENFKRDIFQQMIEHQTEIMEEENQLEENQLEENQLEENQLEENQLEENQLKENQPTYPVAPDSAEENIYAKEPSSWTSDKKSERQFQRRMKMDQLFAKVFNQRKYKTLKELTDETNLDKSRVRKVLRRIGKIKRSKWRISSYYLRAYNSEIFNSTGQIESNILTNVYRHIICSFSSLKFLRVNELCERTGLAENEILKALRVIGRKCSTKWRLLNYEKPKKHVHRGH